MVHLTSPYVPEYLAFREVEYLIAAISRLKEKKPNLLPQVTFTYVSWTLPYYWHSDQIIIIIIIIVIIVIIKFVIVIHLTG